jgi:tripartite-type tricarboxylate transporter receptor subunit TctC
MLIKAACAALTVFGTATFAASAESVADFYKGKTVSLIIASAEGGGYDISGRVTAEYLSRHIPGRPTVIARNMPGASGMRAADYMYNVAAQDGTVISIPQPTMLLNKLVDPSARYDPQGFAWIGRLAPLKTYGVAWHAAPVQSVDRAKSQELVLAAAQGPGTGSNVVMALNQLVGTKFVLVKGYKSVSESGLAMERGEVQGISSTSWEYLESKGWIAGKRVTFLYVIGLKRDPKIPDARTMGEFAANNADRDVLNAIASASEIGRAILAPPNVPAERIGALRAAFDALARDPDFIRESARRKVDVEPLPGGDLQQMVVQSMDLTPDVAERTRRTIRQ